MAVTGGGKIFTNKNIHLHGEEARRDNEPLLTLTVFRPFSP